MLKTKTFSQKLRLYLFISSALAVVFISTFIYFSTSKRMYNTKVDTVVSEISLMSGVIDEKIDSLNNIAKYLASNNEVQTILATEKYDNYDQKFADVQKLYTLVSSVEVRSGDVPIYIMSVNNPLAQYSNQENFEGVFSDVNGYGFNKIVTVAENRFNNGFYIHRRVSGKDNKDVVLTIVQKVIQYDSDKTVGYVFIDVYDEYFDMIIQDNFLGNKANILITTNQGQVITDKNEKTMTGNIEKNIEGDSFGNKKVKVENRNRRSYYSKQLEQTGFYIQEIVADITLKEEGILLLLMIIVATLIILLFSVLVSKYFSNIISEPISKLTHSMIQVELGELNAYVDIEGNDEIAVLGKKFNSMLNSINELIDQVYVKQMLLNEADIKLLKSKMNPHFINNTIESIKWLLKDGENERALLMLTALGVVIKENVNDKDEVLLLEDLIFINNYILIQKIRFEDKLDFQMEVDESLFDEEIPRLLIQPLVENAIIHGIEPLSENGKIIITISRINDNINIRIADNGPGIEASIPRNQVALKNIQSRLKLYYGNQHFFSLHEEDEWTIAEISFPVNTKEEVS